MRFYLIPMRNSLPIASFETLWSIFYHYFSLARFGSYNGLVPFTALIYRYL